jgi:opacity protein-like surface antigen
MMNRLKAIHCAAVTACLLLAGVSSAQAQISRVEASQSVSFNVGYFSLRGLESRVDGDVLFADLSQGEYSLLFDVKDFNGATFGGEWLFGFGDYLEGGVGAGFYQRTVPSIYDRKVRDDGSELEQDLKLRVVPITVTGRVLLAGRRSVQPYIGGGIGFFNWRYSEVGEFIDERTDITFRDRFVSSGTAPGGIFLLGVRAPVADVWLLGAEVRGQWAKGKIDDEAGMLGDRIDLGGWTTSFTFALRF